jgi:hypothetical protein
MKGQLNNLTRKVATYSKGGHNLLQELEETFFSIMPHLSW